MLQLDRGKAMHFLTDALESMGFTWAYRVVDSRAFGLPQRRQRVILVASTTEDPRSVIFTDDKGEPEEKPDDAVAFGFYWTEGTRGLGWAVNAIPTLKGGSTVGIPSPPAIWFRDTDEIVTPEIRDAERLQGFEVDWTLPALKASRVKKGARWKLVGNAVSVPVARWVAERLLEPGDPIVPTEAHVFHTDVWPKAAWGRKGKRFRVDISMWPDAVERPPLRDFLKFPTIPLSERAASGFYSRARASSLRFQPDFLAGVERHIEKMQKASKLPPKASIPHEAVLIG